VIPGQVVLDGEFVGLRGSLAVPVLFDQRGWAQVIELPIANDERIALDNSSRAVEIANDS
jgi:malate/lactate dehydrogenase